MAPPVTNDGFCASKPKYRQKNRRKALTEKQWGAALALVPQINQNHWLLKLQAKEKKETLKNIPLAAERPGGVGPKHVTYSEDRLCKHPPLQLRAPDQGRVGSPREGEGDGKEVARGS